jgi:hypothetical protein
MPGHGVEWNEQISKRLGRTGNGRLLSAIDDVSKESYVDKTRLGCVGRKLWWIFGILFSRNTQQPL